MAFIVLSPALLLSAILIGIIYVLVKWKQQTLDQVPGFIEILLLGHARFLKFRATAPNIHLLSDMQAVLSGLALMYKYEGIYKIRLVFKNFVILTSQKTVEAITSSKTELHKGDLYISAKANMGNGLITSNGDDMWRKHRKLIGVNFSNRTLYDHYLPVMDKHAKKFAAILKANSCKEYVDITPMSSSCTFDVIMESAMGVITNAQDQNGNVEYKEWLAITSEIWMERLIWPWLQIPYFFPFTRIGKRFNRTIKKVTGYAKKVVAERSAAIEMNLKMGQTESDNKKIKSFLDYLLECKNENDDCISSQGILDEVNTFIGAGYETTAYSTAWAIYLIGLYPEVQNKLQDELDAILGDDLTRVINHEDIAAMKYLDCVVKESMRLYPAVPMIGRQLQEDMIIEGSLVKKGTGVVTYIWGMHRDESYFPDPEKFDPDRQFPEKGFMAFSAGLRSCVGQKFAVYEEKTILANIFRQLNVTSLDQRDKVLYLPMVLGKPDRELRVKIEPRVSKYV